MRILYFHQYFSTPAGSGGTRSYEMALELVKAGHEVHIICGSTKSGDSGLAGKYLRGKRSGVVDGIFVTEFDVEYSNHDSFLARTTKFLKFAFKSIFIALGSKHDLIYATSTPLTAAIPGICAKLLKRSIFVFEVRDLWPELPEKMGVIRNPVVLWAMSLLELVSYRSANACVGLSPGIVEGIKRRGSRDLPIAMIPNGCDLALFSSEGLEPKTIEGVDEGDFVAVFTGAHGIANGLDAVLDAASILKSAEWNHIKLLFIGDGKLKPALLVRKEKEGLSNCIFLPPVAKTELPAYMARADIALMVLKNVPAFYYGTSPNKFFDYLAMGKPILNNYPGWIADFIESRSLGRVVQADSAVEFADALMELSNKRQDLVEMGKNSSALAKERFSRKDLAGQLVRFLEMQYQKNEG